MKKYFAYFLCLTLLICLVSPLKVNAASTTKVTEHVTMVGDAINTTLWDGVTVERMHIKTPRAGNHPSDTGLIYDWDSVSVIAANNPAIKIASWGITTTSGYKQGTTAAIAKDYENKHKGYTVLAAVNGDFFANDSFETSAGISMRPTYEPINCWVADGGQTLKKAVIANPHHQVLGIRLDRTYTYHIGSFYNSDGTPAENEANMPNNGSNLPTFTDTLIYNEGENQIKAVVTSGTLDEDAVNIVLKGATNVNVEGYAVYKCYMDRYSKPNDGFQGKYFVGSERADFAYNYSYTGLYIKARSMGAENVSTIASVDEGYCYIVTKLDAVKEALNVRATSFVCQYNLTGSTWGNVNSTIGTVIPFLLNSQRTYCVSNVDNYLNDNKPKTVVAFDANNRCMFYFMGPGPLSGAIGTSGPSSIEMCEMLERFGAVNAFCLDGGGSATICVKGADGSFVTLNNPTDTGGIRSIGNALLMIIENSNLTTTEVKSTSATFGQSAPMAESTLKSAKLYINGRSYNLVDGEYTLTGLQPSTSYEYYFEYTYENENGEYSSKTNVQTFTTPATDEVDPNPIDPDPIDPDPIDPNPGQQDDSKQSGGFNCNFGGVVVAFVGAVGLFAISFKKREW